MPLRTLQEKWEDLAKADPLGAICTDPARHQGKWMAEEFFATGQQEIHTVFKYLQSLGLTPDRKAPALDFGCGVGRLTRALSAYFDECWGVDISPTMIRLAKDFHQNNSHCNFLLNQSDALLNFSTGTFGFIYSSIVFQHMRSKYVRRYLRELVRVLKPGGVFVFQIADRDCNPLLERVRNSVGFRRRWNRLLGRELPAASRVEMHCTPESKVRKRLTNENVRIVDVKLTNSTARDFNGKLQFLEEEPQRGYVSKQYCIVKSAR